MQVGAFGCDAAGQREDFERLDQGRGRFGPGEPDARLGEAADAREHERRPLRQSSYGALDFPAQVTAGRKPYRKGMQGETPLSMQTRNVGFEHSWLVRRALDHCLCQDLFQTKRSDACDEIVGNRLVEGKPEVAFLSCIRRNGLFEGSVAPDGRIQADVVLESREVHKNSTLSKRRHSVADDFARLGRSLAHDLAHALKNALNFRREGCDVSVYRRWLGCRTLLHRRRSQEPRDLPFAWAESGSTMAGQPSFLVLFFNVNR
jgi:hypothetical protein